MFVSQVREFGDVDELRRTEVADPTPGAGEIVMAVEAAGVNRADLLFRSGRYHRAPALPPRRDQLRRAGPPEPDVSAVRTSQTFIALAGRPWRDETWPGRARVTDLSRAVRIPDSRRLRPVMAALEMNLVGVALEL